MGLARNLVFYKQFVPQATSIPMANYAWRWWGKRSSEWLASYRYVEFTVATPSVRSG